MVAPPVRSSSAKAVRPSAAPAHTARLSVTRLEERDVPAATVTAALTANAVWGGTSGAVTLTRTGAVTSALTVNYTVGGSAVAGHDYTALSGAATFAAGSATARVSVVALAHSTDGSDVLLTLASGSGYTVGSPASADVTVIDVPDTVTAYGGFASTIEGAATSVPLLNLSSDLDGYALTVAGVTPGTSGTVAVNASGVATYTPKAGFSGTDSFTYTVQDQYGNASTGSVSVAVVAPAAASTAVWTAANTATAVNVTSLGVEDGGTLSATAVTQGAHGRVTLSNGTATYTPASGYTGTDAFTYTLTDGYGNTATGTVAVTVGTSVPVALDTAAATSVAVAQTARTAATSSGGPVTVAVLNSAFDPAGNTLSVSGVTQGADGGVVLNANGTVTYTPQAGFSGSDSFTYTVTDGLGNTATGTVAVSVGPTAPLALTAAASTAVNTAVTFDATPFVSAAPGDAVTVTGVTSAANGTATLNANGTITYTPDAGFTGTDTFGYTVQDAFGAVSTGSVDVSVTSTALVSAGSTTAWTGAGTALALTVLNLAYDANGVPLSVSGVTQGAHGSVTTNGNGTVTYTPASGYTGTDTFTYTATDGLGDSATGTVTVAVGPTAPTVLGTAATTAAGTAVNMAVLNLASDPNGDALSVASVTQGSHGSVVINANGTVTYTPAAGFTGIDTFTYTVADPYGHPAVGTGTVTVGPAVPVALAADAATATGAAVSVAVQSFVSDPGTLTTTAVTQGAHGGVVINADGTVTYTPAAGFSGTDAFTYTVKDGGGQAATGTITVLVGGAAPAAADVQQAQNVMALMTSELSNPGNVPTGLLPAQSAAVAARIRSALGSLVATVIPPGFGEFTIGVSYYLNGIANYKKQVGVLVALDRLLSANGYAIANPETQLDAAAKAKPFNLALTNKLQAQINSLTTISTALSDAYGVLSLDAGLYRGTLLADYRAMQIALPPDLFNRIPAPTPLPVPNPKKWFGR